MFQLRNIAFTELLLILLWAGCTSDPSVGTEIAPVIDSVTPSFGDTTGRTLVTIHGNNFLEGATVLFDSTPATSIEVMDSKHIECITPSNNNCVGVVDVEVVNPNGRNDIGEDMFNYFHEKLRFPETPTIILDRSGVRTAALADVTGNGGLDIIVTHDPVTGDDQNRICVLEGIGDGSFSMEQCTSIGTGQMNITDIAVGDFNGDDKEDLAISRGHTEDIIIMEVEDNGNLSEIFRIPLGQYQSPFRIVSCDIDHDDDVDLVIAANQFSGYSFSQTWILLGLNRGDGLLELSELHHSDNAAIFDLTIGDINGDSILDIVHSQLGEILSWTGVGDGSFILVDQWQIASEMDDLVYSIALADHDLDNVQDLYILAGDYLIFTPQEEVNNGELVLMKGNGDGSYLSHAREIVGLTPRSILVDFFDDDDVPDIAVTDTYDFLITLFRGENGSISRVGDYSVGQYPTEAHSGDVDEDRLNDILVINHQGNADNSTSLLRNSGGMDFEGQRALRSGNSPRAVVADDFTGNGRIDLAVLNVQDSSIALIPGKGNGEFDNGSSHTLDFNASIMRGFNLDNDSEVELVLTSSSSTFEIPHTIEVLDNNPSEGIIVRSKNTFDFNPAFISSGDWNCDGYVDLAVLGRSFIDPGTQIERIFGVWILLANEDGSFSIANFYDYGSVEQACISSGDINGDDQIDIIAGDSSLDDFLLLIGNGDGSFDHNFAKIGTGINSCTAGDYNGDEHIDIMVSSTTTSGGNEHHGIVTLFTGDGLGGFARDDTTPSIEGIPWYVLYPSTVDVDGDGISDALGSAPSIGHVAVFRINGISGEFRPPDLFQTGGFVSGLSANDFDGDGDQDIAAVGDHIQVRILLNGLGACME